MDQTASLVEYLQKYKPAAIILHGSRATGKNREGSDWDIYVLVSEAEQERTAGTELWQGESIDLDIIRLPITDEKLLENFGSTLLSPKILYDPQEVAAALIEKIRMIYSKGRKLSAADREEEKHHLERLIHRMQSTVEESGVFFYHLSTFYRTAIDYWFDVHAEWSRPIYEALPLIFTKDPAYHAQLVVLAGDTSPKQKVKAAESIQQQL